MFNSHLQISEKPVTTLDNAGPDVQRGENRVSEYTSKFYEKMYKKGYKDNNGEEDFKIKINCGAELRELNKLLNVAEVMIFRQKVVERYDSMVEMGEDPSKWGGIIKDWENEQTVLEDGYKSVEDTEQYKLKVLAYREALEFIENHSERCLSIINSESECDYEEELKNEKILGLTSNEYYDKRKLEFLKKRIDLINDKKHEPWATKFSLIHFFNRNFRELTDTASEEVNAQLIKFLDSLPAI